MYANFQIFQKRERLKKYKNGSIYYSEINFVYYLYSKVHFDDADGYILLSIW